VWKGREEGRYACQDDGLDELVTMRRKGGRKGGRGGREGRKKDEK